MKFKKSEMWDMLMFDNETLKQINEKLYQKKMQLVEELERQMREDNHIEVTFVEKGL